jgi:HlyD family secretion protein
MIERGLHSPDEVSIMFHARRFFWLLGLGLLVGTAAGAGWIFNHSEAQEKAPAPKADAVGGGGVICLGYVDVEPGVAGLYPLHPGQVVQLAEEGQHVSKGAILLQVDDGIPREDLRRAQAALDAARKNLEKAKLLPQQQKRLLEQLSAAVAAAQQQKVQAEKELALKKRAVKLATIPVEEQQVAEAKVAQAAALIRAAQAKLKEAQDAQPQLDVDLAQTDVEAKKALAAKAQLAVDQCQVKAPDDGEVLRVLTSVGETLGTTPKMPAIQFCPTGPKHPRIVRAEVQQEWAARVKVGQSVVIEDDSATALRWPGRVKRLSDWFTHRRSIIQEPFQMNDVRTLECLVEITGPGPERPRIGQRMRVIIK